MTLEYHSGTVSYLVTVGGGLLKEAGRLFNLNRKVLVVTDEGVPKEYSQTVLDQCAEGHLLVLPQGDGSKSLANLELILASLLKHGFTRSDAVVSVGGGMVGDIAGFAAACYMRGVEYYNVPTTLLAQVDSSVGGKTAVNFHGVKNIVGAFHHPSGVLVDPSVLRTLPPRLFAEGMAEVIKMAATSDSSLFRLLEETDSIDSILTEVIQSALRIKLDVVARDPSETGLRAVLNFGHTIGHAIEAAGSRGASRRQDRNHPRLRKREGPTKWEGSQSDVPTPRSSPAAGDFYHGEAVAVGMLYASSGEAKDRIENLLLKFGLPVSDPFSTEELMAPARSDKKRSGTATKLVIVDKIGTYSFVSLDDSQLEALIQARKK